MSRILVTGGTGFIGAHLVQALVSAGHDVRVLVRPDSQRAQVVPVGVGKIVGDIADERALAEAVQGMEMVVHLAGTAFGPKLSVENPLESARVNLWGTLVLLEKARLAGVKRFLFASSYMVYGNAASPLTSTTVLQPLTPYALHKAQCEQALRQYAELYGMETLSLRLFNVYGPGMRPVQGWKPVTLIFLEKVRQQQPVTIEGDGLQTCDFTHVKDVLRAFKLACDSSHVFRGECINIASGAPTSMLDLAKFFGGTIEYMPARTTGSIQNVLADTSEAEQLLGWRPLISMQEGIRELFGDLL